MNIEWNANGYTSDFSFVHHYGEDVLSLITSKPGSTVLDLGCGNGALSVKLQEMGYSVIGLDASKEMLEKARELHPEMTFLEGSAIDFTLDEPVDVIFSNAVLHWIDSWNQEKMLSSIARNLKKGGEFVFEFGGKDCAEAVHSTLEAIFSERGLHYPRTFYFPTIGEYAPMLEKAGFRVSYAILFDRPTLQKGERGLSSWIRMFDTKPFEGMAEEETEAIIQEAEKRLKPVLCKDGRWYVDYVRIRMRAIKVEA